MSLTIGLGITLGALVTYAPAFTVAGDLPTLDAAVTVTVFAAGTIALSVAGDLPTLDAAVSANLIRYPVDAVTSVAWNFFYDSTKGVTQSGGVASAIADQSTAGHNGSSSGASRPGVTATDATCGNQQTLFSDGVDDTFDTGWIPPAPGTTPSFFMGVVKFNTWTSADMMHGAGTTTMTLQQNGSSPGISQRNTTVANNNTAGTLGAWKRIYALYSNSTADRIQVGSTNVTGTNAGNTAAAANLCVFSRSSAGAASIDAAMRFYGSTAGEPTAGEKTELDAYFNAITGLTLT